MTELEWNQCIDPLRMLEDLPTFVRCGKLILFAVACCRRLGKDLRHPSIWRLLEAAERFAQGRLPVESFQEHIVLATAEHSAGNNQRKGRGHPDRSGLAAIGLIRAVSGQKPDALASGLPPRSQGAVRAALRELQNQLTHLNNPRTSFGSFGDVQLRERERQAAILRDVVGPASQPVAADAGWLASAVIGLARSIAAEDDFSAMPILADALEESGCDSPEVLRHCRRSAPHARSCWVIELLLAREEPEAEPTAAAAKEEKEEEKGTS